MKWNATDINSYVKEKQYVDTAVIPLLPVSLGSGIKGSVAAGEYITIIANELEKQLKGRLLLLPAFAYLESESLDVRAERLKQWVDEALEGGTKYIIFLTADPAWKEQEEKLGETLIWLPAVPLENMDREYRSEMVSMQIKQLLKVVTDKWF